MRNARSLSCGKKGLYVAGLRRENPGRTRLAGRKGSYSTSHQGAMLAHRVSHGGNNGSGPGPERSRHHNAIDIIYSRLKLDEEKNISTSKAGKTLSPTMTRASVHVPHLLCPRQLQPVRLACIGVWAPIQASLAVLAIQRRPPESAGNCGFRNKFSLKSIARRYQFWEGSSCV
jgi:hypothetical protein